MMEKKVRVFRPDALMDEYRELLKDQSIEALPLLITGNSMSPFLVHQRDTVYLAKINRPLKTGDAVLYQRDNGSYVLHRIKKIENGCYTMIGDGQFALEKGIRTDQLIAVMTSCHRKGKLQKPGCFWWEFFEKVWIHLLPFRKGIIKGVSWFRKKG